MRVKWIVARPYLVAGLFGAVFGVLLAAINISRSFGEWVGGFAFVLLYATAIPVTFIEGLYSNVSGSHLGSLGVFGLLSAEWAFIFIAVRWLVRNKEPRDRWIWYVLAMPVIFFLVMAYVTVFPIQS